MTLLGQSSGGTSIFGHLIAPESESLFSAAISLSGSANISMSLEAAYEQNKDFPQSVNCTDKEEIMKCLRSVPAEV